jgi:glycine betaine/choline ABC-type transport system substrate-binding protein
MTFREDVLDEYPEIAEVFEPIAALLTNDSLQGAQRSRGVDAEEPRTSRGTGLPRGGEPDRRLS